MSKTMTDLSREIINAVHSELGQHFLNAYGSSMYYHRESKLWKEISALIEKHSMKCPCCGQEDIVCRDCLDEGCGCVSNARMKVINVKE